MRRILKWGLLGVKQYPNQFGSDEEIARQLRRLFSLLPANGGRLVARVFYDTLKLAYYIRGEKAARARPAVQRIVDLDRKEIARTLEIISYHHWKAERIPVTGELRICFGDCDESEARRYCRLYLVGQTVKDKYGRIITFGQQPHIFLYKDDSTGAHIVAPDNYNPTRGKRLSWIKHTVRNSQEIYEQRYRGFLVLMYVHEYSIELSNGETDDCYWVVIVRRGQRDYRGAFKFKTAYPITDYNGFLRKLAGWKPARIPNNPT